MENEKIRTTGYTGSAPGQDRWAGFVDFFVVLTIFHSMGFPGTYTEIFGESIYYLIDYSLFAMEIVVMVLTSASDPRNVKLVDLKKQYWTIYLFVFVVFLESVLVADSFSSQFIRCLHFSVTVFYAIWLEERYDIENLIRIFADAQVLITFFCIFMIVLRPEIAFVSNYGSQIRYFAGIFKVKNECGSEISFGIIILLLHLKMSRWKKRTVSVKYLICLVIDIAFFALTRAAGSIITTLIVSFFIFHCKEKDDGNHRLSLGVLYIIVSILFLVVVFTILPVFTPLFHAIGKSATLSGRTVLWRRLLTVILQHNTMTGWGYFNFWRQKDSIALVHSVFPQNSWYRTMDTGAHNDIFELWVNTGLIGISLYFLILLYAFRDMKRLTNEEYLLCGSIMILETIHGLTERTFTIFSFQTQMLFIVLAVACSAMWRERKVLKVYQKKVGEYEYAFDRYSGHDSHRPGAVCPPPAGMDQIRRR
ncbi:MAG: O-antigen ligase family protein [Lachnospiraceae bacterium]|nr:O-antigen ligase family protein [Lachnospiraceae bacterium]